MQRKPTINMKEAAEFLGFKGTHHFREKVKAGLIPGAFKISNRWMFLMDDLIEFVRSYSKNLNEKNEQLSKNIEWPLAKRKIAHTITRGLPSMELECKNLREKLLVDARKNMKKGAEKK